jgi:hypothetical protein
MTRVIRIGRLLLVAALLLAFTLAGAAGADPAPNVALHPRVLRLGQQAKIVVSATHARSLEVRLAGATDIAGKTLPWQPLRLAGAVWQGSLRAPALRGVYPVELRIGPGIQPVRPTRVFLRVFARNTLARPSFPTPIGAVRWWVRAVPRGRLLALRAWPRPAFDRRDLRLHRLFVVAYSRPGLPAALGRLGMFVEVFRNGYRARWRMLEATVAP